MKFLQLIWRRKIKSIEIVPHRQMTNRLCWIFSSHSCAKSVSVEHNCGTITETLLTTDRLANLVCACGICGLWWRNTRTTVLFHTDCKQCVPWHDSEEIRVLQRNTRVMEEEENDEERRISYSQSWFSVLVGEVEYWNVEQQLKRD